MAALGWLLNLDFAAGTAAEATTVAGLPGRWQRVILPDGRELRVSRHEIASIRAELEARARQEGEAKIKETRRVRKKGKRMATRVAEVPVVITVPDEPSIAIPRSFIPEDTLDVDKARISDIVSGLIERRRREEEDALLLVVAVA